MLTNLKHSLASKWVQKDDTVSAVCHTLFYLLDGISPVLLIFIHPFQLEILYSKEWDPKINSEHFPYAWILKNKKTVCLCHLLQKYKHQLHWIWNKTCKNNKMKDKGNNVSKIIFWFSFLFPIMNCKGLNRLSHQHSLSGEDRLMKTRI